MENSCDVCEQRKVVRRNQKTGTAICQNCYGIARYKDTSLHEKCFECGEVKHVAGRDEGGLAICPNCYQRARYKDTSLHEKCLKCDEVKPVARRSETGRAICNTCQQRSRIGSCKECLQTTVIQALGLCYACYQRKRRADTIQSSPA